MEPARPGGPGTAAGTRGSTPGSEVIGVPVPGGTLAVEHIRSLSEPVLAIHGISSQRKLWNWLRAAAPGISLIAPDLRGRGDSIGVTGTDSGPGGQAPIARHAAVRETAPLLDPITLPRS